MDNKEIVKMLKRANTEGILSALVPDFMEVHLRTHDTATHCNIFLTSPDDEDLKIWYKTNWIDSGYEFNEDGKIKGLQHGCEFIEPVLTSFFEKVEAELDRLDEERELAKLSEEEKKALEHQQLIDRYKKRTEEGNLEAYL